jgi:hypothetical protein
VVGPFFLYIQYVLFGPAAFFHQQSVHAPDAGVISPGTSDIGQPKPFKVVFPSFHIHVNAAVNKGRMKYEIKNLAFSIKQRRAHGPYKAEDIGMAEERI